ncbi:hypothetical protein IQ270_28645 [Microcoleus sp. LEGE 07076]|uniref:hypothetical protein n=1 Tax=Microcoleus sp. LEGE 07076 TaxID=915322 RepID=UPI0018817AB3|nr:hypothetical protein [Microcoleus sp. LEGE 07076]MBE9188496.1 hypothetical protein [Microcoleus sp. LEGE 07076]
MRNFNSSTKFFILLIATIVIVAVWVTAVNAQVQLTERSKLAINGIGPIRVGMTVDEASESARIKFTKGGGGRDEYQCSYVEPKGEPKGIAFMVTKGRIARVDIFSNKQITTIKGAKIGDTEDRIISLYPGQVQVTRHPYQRLPLTNQKYLTFVPKDAADKNYRIIFETSKNRVERFRSGKIPEVEQVEGCS